MELAELTPFLTGVGAAVAAFFAARSGEKKRLEEMDMRIRKESEAAFERQADRLDVLVRENSELRASLHAVEQADVTKKREVADSMMRRANKLVPKADRAKLWIPSEMMIDTAPAPLLELPPPEPSSSDVFQRNKPYEPAAPLGRRTTDRLHEQFPSSLKTWTDKDQT